MIALRTARQRPSSSTVALAGAVALTMALPGCSGDAEVPAATSGSDTATAPADTGDSPTEAPADDTDDSTETAEEQPAAQGGGSATLTVGDQTWDFEGVVCGFGEEEIGDEGAEFVLSAFEDGAQLYVSIDIHGHMVSLNDVSNVEDPSVALDSALATNAGEFIEVSGKNASAQMSMFDELSGTEVDASFEGSCP